MCNSAATGAPLPELGVPTKVSVVSVTTDVWSLEKDAVLVNKPVAVLLTSALITRTPLVPAVTVPTVNE